MKKPKRTPDLLDRIMASNCSDSAKVIKLFAVTQLHYRTGLGDEAWEKMRELIGTDAVSALAFIAGFSMARTGTNKDRPRLLDLVPEMKE